MLTDEMRAEGWLEHNGGPCPVAPKDIVTPLYRLSADPTKGVRIEWATCAGFLVWEHDGEDDDIIAYKPENTDGH